MDYFIFNFYFFMTWILIMAGVIAIIIKLPTKVKTKIGRDDLIAYEKHGHKEQWEYFKEQVEANIDEYLSNQNKLNCT